MVDQRSRKERLEVKARRLKAKFRQEILTPEKFILVLAPLFLGLCLLGSISNLSRNWSLQQEVNSKEAELAYLKLETDNYELENQYYASEEYQELAARRLQNKQFPGETLVYLPKNTESARRKHQKTTSAEQDIRNEKTNFDQWMSFLFHL